jgi:small Trp-rich protein
LAVAWWYWADASGYTKRKAMEKENAKKQARIDKNKEAIGTLTTKRKR